MKNLKQLIIESESNKINLNLSNEDELYLLLNALYYRWYQYSTDRDINSNIKGYMKKYETLYAKIIKNIKDSDINLDKNYDTELSNIKGINLKH